MLSSQTPGKYGNEWFAVQQGERVRDDKLFVGCFSDTALMLDDISGKIALLNYEIIVLICERLFLEHSL